MPDRNWSPNDSRPATPEWTRTNFDTVIEVFDAKAGIVLAAVRADEMLGPPSNDNLAYAVVETNAGDTRGLVFWLRLVGGEQMSRRRAECLRRGPTHVR